MENNLKLNYKNTFFIATSFFSILMLWQVYNHYCPIFLEVLLTERFANNEDQLFYFIGMIMAADNLFALFMLPLFGHLSDKTKTKFGKRIPYIIIGMLASAILFPIIAVMFINKSLVGLIIMMGVILIVMNAYRAPAVALMPDLTPKPLRSGANGIINLVGYIGAILAGGIAMFIKSDSPMLAFIIASLFMLAALVILITTINENRILKTMEKDLELGERLSESFEKTEDNKPLSKIDKKNLIILLISILFWFISFNAIETFNSIFSKKILGNESINGTFVILLTLSSIITFASTTKLANKIGRKLSVLIGLVSIIIGFLIITIYTFSLNPVTEEIVKGFNPERMEVFLKLIKAASLDEVDWTSVKVLNPVNIWIVYLSIVLCGIGWALINVNSFPMVVEMSSKNNIGKFTGYYYASSMIAQTITPVLVGLIMSFNNLGLKLLYVYSLITMIIALLIFLLFKENKEMIKIKKSGFSVLDN